MKKASPVGAALRCGIKIVLKALLLLPIPAFVVWFNMRTAESASYQAVQFERDSAEALLSGQALEGFNTLDERLILQQLVESLEEPFNTLALGSSRILQMDESVADAPGSFYNCGVSGADYRDVMNIFYLFDKADRLPENLILGLDPWLLNADANMLHHRSDQELFDEFLALKLGYDTGWQPAEEERATAALFSPAAFQENLAYALQPEPEPEPVPVAQGNLYDKHQELKMPDGSTLYTVEFRQKSDGDTWHQALQQGNPFLRMDDYQTPDAALCELFHRFVSYARSRGVNVILVMLPYHPATYTYVMDNSGRYTGFFRTEPWFVAYARAFDVPLYGSYNPFVTDSRTWQFYDGLHIKGEAIPEIFPGVQAVLDAQRRGQDTQSPWNVAGPRVSYTVAERLVVEKYEIPEEQAVRQSWDVTIKGELCYTVFRYSSHDEDAILLARYAVSRREGAVWRYDTTLPTWVQDPILPGG